MFEDLAGVDLCGLSGAELAARVLVIEAARAELDALDMATLSRFDADQVYAADGATGTAAWLRQQCGTAKGLARERVLVARRLRSMPLTAAAFSAGDISYGKVRLLAFARLDRLAEMFDRDESILVEAARRFDCDDLAGVLATWKAYADPDGVSDDAAAQWTRRRMSMTQGFDGSWSLQGTLDAESGAIVAGTLQAIIDEFRRGDAADPVAPDRSAPQRSADALVEMARRAAVCDPTRSRPNRPEMIGLLDSDTVFSGTGGHAELLDGTILPRDTASRFVCDAIVRLAVITGEADILDLGRSTPTVSPAQRRALELRDGGCIWPACERPPTWCEGHHLVPFQRGSPNGGPTDLGNLALVCRRHHHLVHDEHFGIARHPITGVITVTRPDGTTASTTQSTGPLNRQRATTATRPEPAEHDPVRELVLQRLQQLKPDEAA